MKQRISTPEELATVAEMRRRRDEAGPPDPRRPGIRGAAGKTGVTPPGV